MSPKLEDILRFVNRTGESRRLKTIALLTRPPGVWQDSLFTQGRALSQARPQERNNRRRTLSGTLRIISNRERRWRSFSVVRHTNAGRGAYTTG